MKNLVEAMYNLKGTEKNINESCNKSKKKLKESTDVVTLDNIADKAIDLGYEVLNDSRDEEGKTILVYKPESTVEDNFNDFDNEGLYNYLSAIPNVRYQIDDNDQSCLAIWLKDMVNEDEETRKPLTKSEARAIAKKVLQEAIGTAYYRLESFENEGYSEDEIEMINKYLDLAASRACRSIGIEYNTY